ncbi:efflux RND transporter periplasmic adaptor subunit [Chelatococcus sambhunathii]|uniref:Efflux RND transporter periplasmic adaptor subunit n=1 Tax=Chelatococcus sambhunathii TaxID=363953 RepID=A0ABU1DDN5_9HYPH|nr:efflux RND transporter periplasmic adaptor subunit [Chelatococcus sambhunathii]MDR4306233.1 efflux RND transporter periplasmic adaptor subunit [Chelatococcus sambhunathii]
MSPRGQTPAAVAKSMKKRRRWPYVAVVLLALGVAAYAFRAEIGLKLAALQAGHAEAAAPAASMAAAEPRLPTITVAQAIRREIAETLVTTGTLVARDEILVGAQIDGLRLEGYLVEVGDHVEKGQTLARLDRDMLETQALQNASQIARADAAVAQVKAAIAEAEANVVEADAALARAVALKKTGNATEETLISRQSASRIAAARVEAQKQNLKVAESEQRLAEAQRREIELRLARTEVKAPAAGVVARRTAQVGQIVGMAGEPLFKIVRDGAIELEAEATETRLHAVSIGQKAQVEVAGFEEPVEGVVRLVEPTVDRDSRLGRVKIALPAGKGLRPGLFARGRIETARRDGVVVPQSALLYGAAGTRVQVVEDGRVIDRPVKTGLADDVGVEILDGLNGGEEVVARAGGFLRDGDRISAVKIPTAQAEAESARAVSGGAGAN